MRFDRDWLLEQLEEAPSADVVAERLTACGLLVEVREPDDGGEMWDVEVTTNRPDAMNHRGLAREAAVAVGGSLRPLSAAVEESDEEVGRLAAVEITAPELCSRYVARVIRGVRLEPSPEWMQRRLERCGVRPINAIVDATNYVLLELGQPLHAFDLDRLAGGRIVVRRAAGGEKLRTLDGEERTLDEDTLLIADAEHAVALAGIMGGADSEIGEATSDVLLESAHFDPLSVRRTARRLGMHTEASHRFERGSDPEMAAVACDVAAALIARLSGGVVCRGRIDAHPRPRPVRRVTMSLAGLSAFTGMEVDPEAAVRILDGLGLAPVVDGDEVACTIPPYRVDLERAADLYEEVIRHVGYDRVPARLPVLSTTPGRRNANWELVDRARRAAVACGLAEVVTYSFIDPVDDELVSAHDLCPGAPLPIVNPLARTQGTMRRSLLPGLVAAARDTLNQGERSLAIFEQGRVFWRCEDHAQEAERLAVVVAGGGNGASGAVEFGDLKGVVESILEGVHAPEVTWRRGGSGWFEAAEAARIVTSEGGSTAGCAGRLTRSVLDRWDLRQPLYAAEIDLAIAASVPPVPQFVPLPRFPAVVADVTLEHPRSLAFAELVREVRDLAAATVSEVELLDRYAGEGLPPEKMRTTLRLLYRHPERSLTQEEVNQAQEALRGALVERLDVGLV
jgi:phenylalanyl-tRNA synthetase beta chain